MSYSGKRITCRTITSLTQLKPGDHIRVPSSKEPAGGGFGLGFTSKSFSSEFGSTSYSSRPYFASGSSSGNSRPELCNGKVYTHHLLVVKPIDGMRVQVIHKVDAKKSIIEEVKCYKPSDVIVLEYDSFYTGQEAVQRAQQIMKKGEDYHLVNKNCEHFVTEVRTGEKQSAQIERAVIGAFGGGAVGTAAGTGGGVGVGVLIGAMIGSIFPGVGTIAGASLGGVIGGFAGAAIGGGGGGAAGGVAGVKTANKKKK